MIKAKLHCDCFFKLKKLLIKHKKTSVKCCIQNFKKYLCKKKIISHFEIKEHPISFFILMCKCFFGCRINLTRIFYYFFLLPKYIILKVDTALKF